MIKYLKNELMEQRGKHMLVLLLWVLMAAMSVPVTAKAADGVACGELSVAGDTSSYEYSADTHTLTIIGSEALTISGTTTAEHIAVQSGVTANITLDGADLQFNDGDASSAGTCAFLIPSDATVNLTLKGENTLKSGYQCAGLQVNGTLVITEASVGGLTATGGNSGAGIGGGYNKGSGSITISGGTVSANGGSSGAGIGGGQDGEGGTITISGGTVNSIGGQSGAGIGGGWWGKGGTITITGGTVNANGGSSGAGIGGGFNGAGGSITISGGTVNSTGGQSGAGIGGCDGKSGTFVTQRDTDSTRGNAVIFASSISDTSGKDGSWNGIIFEGDSGKVYGSRVTPTEDFTIDSGKTLTIPSGVTLDNKGSFIVKGSVINYSDTDVKGTIENGEIHQDLNHDGVCDKCTSEGSCSYFDNVTVSDYSNTATGKSGEDITLSASVTPKNAEQTVTFRWYEKSADNTYTAVNEAVGNSYVVKKVTKGIYEYRLEAVCDDVIRWIPFTVEVTCDCSAYENGFCTICGAYQTAKETKDQYDIDGDSIKDTVYEISNAGQLYWFAGLVNGDSRICDYDEISNPEGTQKNTAACAVLTADITVNKYLLKNLNDDGTAKNGYTVQNWTPIGNDTCQYTGTFDGKNHTISGLYCCDDETLRIGLFGYLGNQGKLCNVGVVDSYLEGKYYVSGICSRNEGTIVNCYNTGTVVTNLCNAAGVCGSNAGTIEHCYNSGEVRGAEKGTVESYYGGVCNSNFGVIRACYNTGRVSGNGHVVGGVCGYNSAYNNFALIENCYNTGEVSGTAYIGNYNMEELVIGGVCGYNQKLSSGADSATIRNCYNAGEVSGTAGTNGTVLEGSVCGSDYRGTINNCYFLTGTGNAALGGNCDTVLEHVLEKTADAFASGEVAYLLQGAQTADVSGTIPQVWGQTIRVDKMPVLTNDSAKKVYITSGECVMYTNDKSQSEKEKTHGDYENNIGICPDCGKHCMPAKMNSENVYEISNAGQLYWFAGLVNGDSRICDYDAESNPEGTQQNTAACAVLTADITVNKDLLKNLSDDGTAKNGYTVQSWTPIGNFTCKYTGTFDGQKHTISGLYFCDSETTLDVGLFGCAWENSSILNVGVVDSYFKGKNHVSGICGMTWCGTIKNCYITGKVEGNNIVGGVCGQNMGYIVNCYNEGSVSGTDNVGGVCGYIDMGTIKNCYYLEGCNAEGTSFTNKEGTSKTTTQFASGEVAYLLQSGQTAEENEDIPEVWGQTLSGSSKQVYPVLGGAKIYKTIGCTGGYSNEENDNKNHDFGQDNVCKDCGWDKGIIENKAGEEGYPAEFMYNGTAITAPTADNFTVNSGATPAFTWYKGDVTAAEDLSAAAEDKMNETPIHAGTYTLLVTADAVAGETETDKDYSAAELRVKVFVQKADSKVVTPPEGVSGLVYDSGRNLTLIHDTEVSVTGGEIQYALGAADGTYSTSLPTVKDAGTYDVYYKVVGDDNHNDTEPVKITVTVDKATPTYTVPANLKANCGDKLSAVSLSGTGFVWTDDTDAVLKAGDPEDGQTVTKTAKYVQDDTGNYKEVTGIRLSIVVTHKYTGETEVRDAVAATCTEKGYSGDTYCTVCDKKIGTGQDIEALGHSFAAEFTVDVAPTCAVKGSKSRHCARCDEKTEVTEIVRTDHTWDAGKVTKEATETAEGEKSYTCSVCGGTKTEAIPKKSGGGSGEPDAQQPPKQGDVVPDDKASATVEVTDVEKKEVSYEEPADKKAKTVTIPATVKIDGVTYEVTKVDDNAFKNNKTVTKVTVGSNITTIGKNAFSGATKLKTVKIGKNVTEVGANAFKGCASLTSVTLSGKTTKIGANAFDGCKKLKTIKITSTKLTSKTVSKNAFKGLTKATTIKVPKKKLAAYKKLFKSKGLSSKVKVKGY